jgi:alcohol dehydrogenase
VTNRFVVEADGGSRGNPGPAGYGALVRDAVTGKVLAERAESVGRATNNVAEYGGLVAGLQAVLDLTGGELPHVVVDATGSQKSMANALHFVGFAGRLVFVGITTQEVPVPHPLMHRREMTLLASRNALSADFARIIRLIEDGRLDTRPWVTHRTPFAGLIDAFPSYLKPETGVIKAVVEVD